MKKKKILKTKVRHYNVLVLAAAAITILVCLGGSLLLTFNRVTAEPDFFRTVCVINTVVCAVGLGVTVFFGLRNIQVGQESCALYEHILNAIPYPVSVTDENMNWIFINKPVSDMLNIKTTEAEGQPCSNWGAGICGTDNCGVACLKRGKQTTFFSQGGSENRVDTSYLKDLKGNVIGHVEVVQDITEMTEVQNAQTELVRGISGICDTFAMSTTNLADGAQALAQGSIQQSSSVEQLSSSMAMVTERITENTTRAEDAAKLAAIIKQNAEKSNNSMIRMMQAVEEINKASQSIEDVIKVIDNIAFQTNILALNAAVEAARAGEAGKGFAVVADEVRNLAAKSSEAAKDTNVLITNNIEKAKFGAQISNETAESLKQIVENIEKSAALIGEMADSSMEQSQAVLQINTGIEQVAGVIQQNSATAEQTAASTEELNSQTQILIEKLDEFNRKYNHT